MYAGIVNRLFNVSMYWRNKWKLHAFADALYVTNDALLIQAKTNKRSMTYTTFSAEYDSVRTFRFHTKSMACMIFKLLMWKVLLEYITILRTAQNISFHLNARFNTQEAMHTKLAIKCCIYRWISKVRRSGESLCITTSPSSFNSENN